MKLDQRDLLLVYMIGVKESDSTILIHIKLNFNFIFSVSSKNPTSLCYHKQKKILLKRYGVAYSLRGSMTRKNLIWAQIRGKANSYLRTVSLGAVTCMLPGETWLCHHTTGLLSPRRCVERQGPEPRATSSRSKVLLLKFLLATPSSCDPAPDAGWRNTAWQAASATSTGVILIPATITSYLVTEIPSWLISTTSALNFSSQLPTGQSEWSFKNADFIVLCPWLGCSHCFHCSWERDPSL